jgi:hypothetical protein
LWDLSKSALKRVDLSKEAGEGTLQGIKMDDRQNIYAASDEFLFRINSETNSITKFADPLFKGQNKASSLQIAADNVLWLKSNVLFELKQKDILTIKEADDFLNEEDKALYHPSSNSIWIIRNEALLSKNLNNKQKRASLIHKATNKFLDLAIVDEELLAHTENTVLRFNINTKKLVQAIPVESKRKLRAFHIERDFHAYIFNDNLLEIYRIKEEKIAQYFIPIKDEDKISKLRVKDNVAAIISDGVLSVFAL